MSSCCVPTLIAPTPTRMTPAPSGITVPPRMNVGTSVSVPPTPARLAPPPTWIVLRQCEQALRLRQLSWAERGRGTGEAEPEEEDA
jgi:hypothetical protein